MIFDAFVSEITAFVCSYKHCFHIVQSCRWSKVWSSPFRWDMDAIRKSKIRIRINSFSAVIIPYIEEIVKRFSSTRKICGAVVKEKLREKSWICFRKSAGLPLSSVVCCCANRKGGTTHEEQVFMLQDVATFYQNIRLSCCKMKESMI